MAQLEHINITVSDAHKIAQMLINLFDWHIRWQGEAKNCGLSMHVGSDDSYLAVYSGPQPDQTVPPAAASYRTLGAMNHIGVIVDDLDSVAANVKALDIPRSTTVIMNRATDFIFTITTGLKPRLSATPER